MERPIRLKYLLFLPTEYENSKAQQWPLLLFLHGAGERGSQLARVTAHGPPRIVKDQPDFPFVLVSPLCPSGEHWHSAVLLRLLDEVSENCRIDPDRLCVSGISMGGYGTWSLATRSPGRFAAAVPICGGGDILSILLADKTKTAALRRLPIWAFHGGKDPIVPAAESERMVEAFRRIGNPAKLTIYPEAGHDSWTETYQNQDLFDWMLAQRRGMRGKTPRGGRSRPS